MRLCKVEFVLKYALFWIILAQGPWKVSNELGMMAKSKKLLTIFPLKLKDVIFANLFPIIVILTDINRAKNLSKVWPWKWCIWHIIPCAGSKTGFHSTHTTVLPAEPERTYWNKICARWTHIIMHFSSKNVINRELYSYIKYFRFLLPPRHHIIVIYHH